MPWTVSVTDNDDPLTRKLHLRHLHIRSNLLVPISLSNDDALTQTLHLRHSYTLSNLLVPISLSNDDPLTRKSHLRHLPTQICELPFHDSSLISNTVRYHMSLLRSHIQQK